MTVVVRRRCASPAEAEALRAAVAADTPAFVGLGVRGASLEIRLTAAGAASARATLEDLFACLKAAERTALAAASPAEEPRHRSVERG